MTRFRAFRIRALPIEPFAPLFTLDDDALSARGARRCVADAKPGFPCRVSLEDAEPGERVILTGYAHQNDGGPYQASGPVFVREGARQAEPEAGEVPESVRIRLLSARAYDRDGLMIGAEVVEGRDLEAQIERWFADPRVRYLHLHNARPGCYNCRVDRL